MNHPQDEFGDRDFVARVMKAISTEPRPTPTGALVRAVRERSINDAINALAVAWHLATARRTPVAPSVRMRSLALVLGAIVALGAASLVGAATIRVVADAATNGAGAGQRGVEEHGEVQNETPDIQVQREVVPPAPNEPDGAGGQSGADEPGVTEIPSGSGDSSRVDVQVEANEPDGDNDQDAAANGTVVLPQADEQASNAGQPSNDAPTVVVEQPASQPAQTSPDQSNSNQAGVNQGGAPAPQASPGSLGSLRSSGAHGGQGGQGGQGTL